MPPKLDPKAIVNIPCPKCGEKTPQTIAEIGTSPRIRCAACGMLFGINAAKIMKKIAEAQASFDARGRGFGN